MEDVVSKNKVVKCIEEHVYSVAIYFTDGSRFVINVPRDFDGWTTGYTTHWEGKK